MHVPRQFEEGRVAVLHEFIEEHPFGALVTMSSSGLDANHVPIELDPGQGPQGVLRCHVARANPVWRNLSPESAGLVIFQGPHAYVSPGWYPSKKATGKAVPTWNYAVVHAHGRLRAVDDEEWLLGLVERLSNRHEAGRKEPWSLSDAPTDFTEKLVRAIVGIEIEITSLTGQWKLGQNRSAEDVAGVVDGLSSEHDAAAAELAELTRDFHGRA